MKKNIYMKKNLYSLLFLLSAFLFPSNLSYTRSIEYPIKAIVFDLDGTIVDSEHFWFSMFLKIVEGHNVTLDSNERTELYNVMHGNTGMKILTWMKEKYALNESVEELQNTYRENSKIYYQGKITFVPGFESFFKCVHCYPLLFAIATNCGPFSSDLICKSVDLEEKFGTHIYHNQHVARGKPAPDIYLHAAKQLGVEPHECLAIEDSATGIKSAQAAGMFCIGLNRGDRSKVAQADLIVDSYEQIDIETLLKGDTAQLGVAYS